MRRFRGIRGWEIRIYFRLFLISTLEGRELSVSLLSCFALRSVSPVLTEYDIGVLWRRKVISCDCLESNLGYSVVQKIRT